MFMFILDSSAPHISISCFILYYIYFCSKMLLVSNLKTFISVEEPLVRFPHIQCTCSVQHMLPRVI